MADLKYNYIIESELEIFEKKFKESVKSKTPLLDRITHYIINRKGKQLRPRFVFLSAKLFGNVNDTTYSAASFVELLHTATLVHDDVVDDANERRGFFSVNALWKNKVAVLVGDYLLSKGMLLALSNDETELLKILSTAISKLIEGELLQLEKARNLNFKEDVYFEIITNKTASLLASVCASGAWSTTKDAEITEQMRLFGEKVGIAFQIKDDLFDYGTDDVGKPTGNDIKEKKLTLPLIHALQHASSSDKREMIYVIKNENTNKERVSWLISKVQSYGGIDYAVNKMQEYRDDALAILDKFPKNEANLALVELVKYSTERKY